MKLNVLKMKIIFWTFITALLFLNCDRKTELDNQITIKVNSIDSKTKQPRRNVFDTIDVRIESIGFPTKRFPKIAEYVTDSSGSVKIKIDRTEKYLLLLGGPYIYGSEDIIGEKFKDDQEVTIEVIHLE
jgi:hypothetical protein